MASRNRAALLTPVSIVQGSNGMRLARIKIGDSAVVGGAGCFGVVRFARPGYRVAGEGWSVFVSDRDLAVARAAREGPKNEGGGTALPRKPHGKATVKARAASARSGASGARSGRR